MRWELFAGKIYCHSCKKYVMFVEFPQLTKRRRVYVEVSCTECVNRVNKRSITPDEYNYWWS